VVRLEELDAIVPVHDGGAILMSQMLASKLGLSVGISSGANLVAALTTQDDLPEGAMVATVFPDSNKKYLSTALFVAEPPRPGYVSTGTELLGFSALPRVCSGCIDYRPAPGTARSSG
jgi:cysteine synthase A